MAHQSLLSVSVVHFRHYADFTLRLAQAISSKKPIVRNRIGS